MDYLSMKQQFVNCNGLAAAGGSGSCEPVYGIEIECNPARNNKTGNDTETRRLVRIMFNKFNISKVFSKLKALETNCV